MALQQVWVLRRGIVPHGDSVEAIFDFEHTAREYIKRQYPDWEDDVNPENPVEYLELESFEVMTLASLLPGDKND